THAPSLLRSCPPQIHSSPAVSTCSPAPSLCSLQHTARTAAPALLVRPTCSPAPPSTGRNVLLPSPEADPGAASPDPSAPWFSYGNEESWRRTGATTTHQLGARPPVPAPMGVTPRDTTSIRAASIVLIVAIGVLDCAFPLFVSHCGSSFSTSAVPSPDGSLQVGWGRFGGPGFEACPCQSSYSFPLSGSWT
ncbi:unnamed protein product, partial [Urochloa humidicola]